MTAVRAPLSCWCPFHHFVSPLLVNSIHLIQFNGILSLSRVIAIRLVATNNTIWESTPLEGACAGTPKISSDGEFVFLTHNLVSSGHFTILFSDLATPLYSQFNPVQPYSPIGIFHNPMEGRYFRGANNTNDILVWSYAPFPEEAGVGQSSTFGFQFPVDFTDVPPDEGFRVITLYNATFQSTAAPLLANNGLNLYFSASRSTFVSWVGLSGRSKGRFDRGATGTAAFARGTPRQLAPFSTLTSSSNNEQLMLFGGTAGLQFVALNSSGEEMWKISTGATIHAEAKVSPDNSRVYFVESNGKVHSLDTMDGSQHWEKILTVNNATITSDFAIMKCGESLYFGDSSGTITAWIVATRQPSLSQSPSPSGLNFISPSQSPATPMKVTSISPSSKDDQSDSFAPSQSLAPFSTLPSQIPSFTKNISGSTVPSGVSFSPSSAAGPSSLPSRISTTPLTIPSEMPSFTFVPTSSAAPSSSSSGMSSIGNYSTSTPLESLTYAPVLPPSPGGPTCNVCGGNLSITILNGTVQLPTDPPTLLSCEKWVSFGKNGSLTTTQCQLAPDYTRNCGCQGPEMQSTAPTVTSASAPSVSAAPDLLPNTTTNSVAPTATSIPLTTSPSSVPRETNAPTLLSIPSPRLEPPKLPPSGSRSPTTSAGSKHYVTMVRVMVLGIAIFT